MLDLHQIYATQKRGLFFLLAGCALGWGFLTSYQTIFAGIALGALFGTYNFWILVRRMEKFDKSISEGRRAASMGMSFRFGSGVAAVAVAMLLPEHFHLISTVIGLMFPYVFVLVERIIYLVRNQ